MIYVAELTAAIDDIGTTQTLLFATQDLTTRPADTPPNTAARGRLMQPGQYQIDMGAGQTLFGAARSAIGELVLANADGALDTVARYGFDGRQVRLLATDATYGPIPAYPAGWTIVLVATVDAVRQDLQTLTLRLRDTTDRLDVPVCTRYAGTGGLEGTSQMTGQAKPRLYGSACNFLPVLIDPAAGIYQISDRPYTQARFGWDKRGGSGLTPVSSLPNDVADYAALVALSVAGGSFARCSDVGLLKLGSAPTGVLTVDGMRHDAAYAPSYGRARLGEILVDIATDAGLSGSDIDPALATLGVPGPSHGLYVVDTDTTYQQAFHRVAASAGAWVGQTRLGVLTAGIVTAPSGPPVWTFSRANSSALQRLPGPFPAPISAAEVKGGYNWRVMSPSDVASGVAQADREALGRQWCYIERAAGAAAAKHKSASPYVVKTLSGPCAPGWPLTLPGNGVGVSPASMLALFGAERDTVVVSCPLSLDLVTAVDLGSVVTVRWPRFGFDAGKLMMVTGVRWDFARNEADVTLWG